MNFVERMEVSRIHCKLKRFLNKIEKRKDYLYVLWGENHVDEYMVYDLELNYLYFEADRFAQRLFELSDVDK